MTNTEYKEYLKSDKWHKIAEERLRIDGYRCVCCGCSGVPGNELEIHHLSYKFLGKEEYRVFEDLVTLCHRCHKNIHAVMNRQTNEEGRRGWADRQDIPTVHTFNISGKSEYAEIPQ